MRPTVGSQRVAERLRGLAPCTSLHLRLPTAFVADRLISRGPLRDWVRCARGAEPRHGLRPGLDLHLLEHMVNVVLHRCA